MQFHTKIIDGALISKGKHNTKKAVKTKIFCNPSFKRFNERCSFCWDDDSFYTKLVLKNEIRALLIKYFRAVVESIILYNEQQKLIYLCVIFMSMKSYILGHFIMKWIWVILKAHVAADSQFQVVYPVSTLN